LTAKILHGKYMMEKFIVTVAYTGIEYMLSQQRVSPILAKYTGLYMVSLYLADGVDVGNVSIEQ
jgi:hypothetical protein